MPQFMLLLHRDDNAPGWKSSPEEMQQALAKYLEWRRKPFVVDGRRLEDSGRLMKKSQDRVTVTDGPFSEAREVLGGYYSIEAQSYDHAVELAGDHPHLDFGTVEVRQLVPPPPK